MTLWVPALLIGFAVLAVVADYLTRRVGVAAAEVTAHNERFLVHAINDERCTGCETCVSACPTNVLQLIGHKSRATQFDQCIQCEKCVHVCPTQALVMHLPDEKPPAIRVPEIDEWFQTKVPGQYLIGEVAGKPLVKNAANLGRMVVEHLIREGVTASGSSDPRDVDVLIVGSGPGGLSAALACVHHGLSHLVVEKEHVVASTVARYPAGKPFIAEPAGTANRSFLPVYDASKEEILSVWTNVIEAAGLNLATGEAVDSVVRRDVGDFEVRTASAAYRAQRVVLATGVRGKPRALGVPGEQLPKVQSMLEDPKVYRGLDVLVVGGGDTALEAVVALHDAGAKVTVSYRGKSFSRASKANKAAIDRLVRSNAAAVHFGSTVIDFGDADVGLRLADGAERRIDNHGAFVLIGADAPVRWLSKVGIEMVERPHSYSAGDTAELLVRLGCVDVCPVDVAAAMARVRGEEPLAVESPNVIASAPRPQRARADSVVSRVFRRFAHTIRRADPVVRRADTGRPRADAVRPRAVRLRADTVRDPVPSSPQRSDDEWESMPTWVVPANEIGLPRSTQ